jgi:hypothetical protein
MKLKTIKPPKLTAIKKPRMSGLTPRRPPATVKAATRDGVGTALVRAQKAARPKAGKIY